MSPFSGRFSYDGRAVEVRIYRLQGTAAGWTLEVLDPEGDSTVWSESFPTDEKAWRAFYATLEARGADQFPSSTTGR